MYTYLTDNKLLGQQQFGFRPIQSTALALGKSINQWLMNVNSGELNSVVFPDIKTLTLLIMEFCSKTWPIMESKIIH